VVGNPHKALGAHEKKKIKKTKDAPIWVVGNPHKALGAHDAVQDCQFVLLGARLLGGHVQLVLHQLGQRPVIQYVCV